jgi:CDP-diacylglycerol--glycerol-3-phosphate 3-phosphatidyltransferase
MQISVDRTEDRALNRPLGPSVNAFWNAPNAISLGRIVACPLLLVYLVYHGPLASAVIGFGFLAVSLTDLLDGYLARRDGTVTAAGKLLDPLADKLLEQLVLTALVLLVGSPGRIPWWGVPLVIAILARELAITGLRAVASAEGIVIPAERLGKWKTGFQTAAITFLLIHQPMFGISSVGVGMLLLMIATALTLTSGYAYFSTYLAGRSS